MRCKGTLVIVLCDQLDAPEDFYVPSTLEKGYRSVSVDEGVEIVPAATDGLRDGKDTVWVVLL